MSPALQELLAGGRMLQHALIEVDGTGIPLSEIGAVHRAPPGSLIRIGYHLYQNQTALTETPVLDDRWEVVSTLPAPTWRELFPELFHGK